jgi:uncharacterized membrane protein (DUF106 family)
LSNLILSDLVTSLNAVNTVAQAAGDNGLQAFGRQLLSFIDPAYAATLEGVAIGINAVKKAAVESEQAIKNENLAKEQAKKVSAELAEKHKKEIEDLKKKAEAAKKAHEERIKQLRKESEEFQKHVRATYKLAVRDPFAEQGPDLNRNADAERQLLMENAGKRLLVLNKQISASMQGIIIPEDAITRLNAAAEAQKQMAIETALVAQYMGAALFVGDMFGQAISQLGEGGKAIFQGIMDSLKALIIRFVAAIAAALTLNILTGGLVMKAGAEAGGKSGLGKLLKGGKSFGIGGLTPFAAGGIVSGPTAALVGEYTGAKTNPEVIAPLSKLQNMMGGNVTFTISGDNLVGTLNRATKTRQRKF